MRTRPFCGIGTSLLLFLLSSVFATQVGASDIYWRIDPSVETCSMVIDPSLTQAQWHKFSREVGAIASFKSMGTAETLGRMHFRVGITDSHSPVDQHDPAWINTFTHPDETCPLGDVIRLPTVRGSVGVSDRVDVGGYWTTAPGANYGAVGGEVKYGFLQESGDLPAAAVRASATVLTGVPDFDLNIYSVELIASKKVAMVTPYVGVRQSLAVGTETTSKVDLDRESVALTSGYAGFAYSIWKLSLAAEYNVSSVNTFALAIGFIQ